MYAHYFKTTKGAYLIITASIQPIGGTTYKVVGKPAARTLARQHNAKAWNF